MLVALAALLGSLAANMPRNRSEAGMLDPFVRTWLQKEAALKGNKPGRASILA
jgi:hypothetical protein